MQSATAETRAALIKPHSDYLHGKIIDACANGNLDSDRMRQALLAKFDRFGQVLDRLDSDDRAAISNVLEEDLHLILAQFIIEAEMLAFRRSVGLGVPTRH